MQNEPFKLFLFSNGFQGLIYSHIEENLLLRKTVILANNAFFQLFHLTM